MSATLSYVDAVDLLDADHKLVQKLFLTSERYTTKQGALGGIAAVKSHSPHDTYYRRLNTTAGVPYFNLRAVNGENIGTSEGYNTVLGRETGVSWVKANGPVASTIDNT
jgi:uncharacterized protein YegP (UPF0339 family)